MKNSQNITNVFLYIIVEKSKAVCISNCDLEGTFHEVRNKETNLANLYADILK